MANPRAKVRLDKLALCRVARVYDHGRTMDLLRVTPQINMDPEQEFPRRMPQLDLYLRFFVDRAGESDFYVRVWWSSFDHSRKKLCYVMGPKSLQFNDRDAMQDHSIRLSNMQLPLPGLYSFLLCRQVRNPLPSKRWLVMGRDYLTIGVSP
jgi:hypothetical protein